MLSAAKPKHGEVRFVCRPKMLQNRRYAATESCATTIHSCLSSYAPDCIEQACAGDAPEDPVVSFDVFMQRFEAGEPAEVHARPVRELLSTTTYRGPDEFGFYIVGFPDGVEVEFSANGLESPGPFTGCAFHVRSFGDSLIQFMFDVAQAGDMVILPAMEGNPLVLVSKAQARELPPDLRESSRSIVVRSANDLAAVLTGGFDSWSGYRDQILRQSKRESEA